MNLDGNRKSLGASLSNIQNLSNIKINRLNDIPASFFFNIRSNLQFQIDNITVSGSIVNNYVNNYVNNTISGIVRDVTTIIINNVTNQNEINNNIFFY